MAQVRVRRGRTDYVMEIRNISESGVLVDMGSLRRPSWLTIGHAVELHILTPGEGPSIGLTGKVVRLQETEGFRGFAVMFDEMDADMLHRLRTLIRDAPVPPPLPHLRGGG